MAHSCPICDQVCHCSGDIDDCILDGTEYQDECIHCEGEDTDDDDDDDDSYDTTDKSEGQVN